MNTMKLKRLRETFNDSRIDGILLRTGSNLRYISGYSGSNGLCYVGREDAWFFTDFRYKTQSAAEVNNMNIIVPEEGDLFAALEKSGCILPGTTVGFEGNRLSYEEAEKMIAMFPKTVFKNTAMLMEELASVKEAEELDALREAARISDAAFARLLDDIRPGITERQLDAKLSFIMKSLGSERDSFDTIVASGPNSARPHHKPTERVLQKGDFVTIDFGAMSRGYHGDVTRTVCLGKADAKQREIYTIVQDAQMTALKGIRAGLTGKAVDAMSRDLIAAKGYGDYFGHGLGHGLGLEIHAEPRLSPKYDKVLKPNQVVTVEPGIYLPGWGGVRIEDDVIVTETGCEIITASPRDLLEL